MTWQAWWYAAAFALTFAAWLIAMRWWRRSLNQRRAVSRENYQLRMDLLRRGFDEQDATLGAQLRPALARGVRAAADMADAMRANPPAADNLRALRQSINRHPSRHQARVGDCVYDTDDLSVCGVHGGPWPNGADRCDYATWWLAGARAAGADQ